MKPPAPNPLSWLSLTNEVRTAQIAASTALPPSRSTCAPASAVSGWPAATTPFAADIRLSVSGRHPRTRPADFRRPIYSPHLPKSCPDAFLRPKDFLALPERDSVCLHGGGGTSARTRMRNRGFSVDRATAGVGCA